MYACPACHPPLASVEHPFKIGVTAAEILLAALDHQSAPGDFRTVVLVPELVVR